MLQQINYEILQREVRRSRTQKASQLLLSNTPPAAFREDGERASWLKNSRGAAWLNESGRRRMKENKKEKKVMRIGWNGNLLNVCCGDSGSTFPSHRQV